MYHVRCALREELRPNIISLCYRVPKWSFRYERMSACDLRTCEVVTRAKANKCRLRTGLRLHMDQT